MDIITNYTEKCNAITRKTLLEMLCKNDAKSNGIDDKNTSTSVIGDILSLSNSNNIYHISTEQLSFYNSNINASTKLTDAINFYNGAIGCTNNELFTFGNGGTGQCIPASAVSRIETSSLASLSAPNNSLTLTNNSYYSYKGTDGNEYAFAFSANTMRRAFSEGILNDDMNTVSTEARIDMVKASSVISALAKGKSPSESSVFSRSDIKNQLNKLGIEVGEFTVEVDGETNKFYLQESGEVLTEESVQKTISLCNEQSWLKAGREVGDTVTVFGNKYTIDETGHINVPTENFWKSEDCSF